MAMGTWLKSIGIVAFLLIGCSSASKDETSASSANLTDDGGAATKDTTGGGQCKEIPGCKKCPSLVALSEYDAGPPGDPVEEGKERGWNACQCDGPNGEPSTATVMNELITCMCFEKCADVCGGGLCIGQDHDKDKCVACGLTQCAAQAGACAADK
jgi:hypothetical protein